jgi:hypothetical protein
MAVTKLANGSMFVPIRSGKPCPVCGSKKGRCAEFYNEEGVKVFYRCKYAVSQRPSNGWYIHTVQEVDGINPAQRPITILPNIEVGEEMTKERMEITNAAYRYFRELVMKYEGAYLNPRDMKNLQDRGLTNEQIDRMLFFSMPTVEITSQEELDSFILAKYKNLYVNSKRFRGKPIKVMVRNYSDGENTYDCQLATAIARDMENKFGEKLLQVAGFVKRSDNKGNDYITFKTTRYNPIYDFIIKLLAIAIITKSASIAKLVFCHYWGVEQYIPIKGFFIPYINPYGQILAVQYRLTVPVYDEKGKEMRYFWYSSSNARSGSPIDYYIPSRIYKDRNGNVRDDIILATEGGIKAKIAAEKLGFKSVAEAGVSNYRNLVETIIEVSKKEGIRHKVIVALDMDKYEKEEVMMAEKETLALLLEAGYEVALAHWDGNKAKGIDDALMRGLKINFKVI